MPKKRTPRQRMQAEQQARAEQRRLAREEQDREAHARLVVERSGDPRFVQRTTTVGGGAVVTWDPDSVEGRALAEALEESRRAFREKFGRDPGPDDPVFFDRDADEPVPMTGLGWRAGFAEMRQAAARSGMDPAYIAAWQEVGYVVAEANQHLFSAAEVRAYLDAVVRHHDDVVDDDGDGWDEDYWDPAGEAAVGLREVVAQVLRDDGPDAGLRLVESLDDAEDADAAGLAASTMVAVMLAWLAGAREQADRPATTATRAVDWVREHLGGQVADDLLLLAGVLGHPRSPDLTAAQVFERAGGDLVPALLWLVCGIVATAGDGEVAWLAQFDLDGDPEKSS
jgi:hypothetical protein